MISKIIYHRNCAICLHEKKLQNGIYDTILNTCNKGKYMKENYEKENE